MTQNEMVLAYMRDNGSITPKEAMDELGCMRLGARIYELKRRGLTIRREMVRQANRYGKEVSFARYRLVE